MDHPLARPAAGGPSPLADPYDFPTPEEKKRNGPRLSLLGIIGILFLLFMVYQTQATITRSEARLEASALEPGDRIQYDFVARLPDGTLWSTTKYDVARQANQTHRFPLEPEFSYTPRTVTLDPDQPGLGWGADAERRVLDARAGSTLRFTVPAEHGTGEWENFTDDGLPRELITQDQFARVVFLQEPAAAATEGNTGSPGFDLDQLDQAIGPLENGTVFKSPRTFPPTWDIIFEDVNFGNRSVTFRHTVQDNQQFQVPGLPGHVTVLLPNNETELVYRLDLVQGSQFAVAQGSDLANAGFTVGSYRVERIDDETIHLLYHPLTNPGQVGQPLSVELTVIQKVAAT